MRERERGVRECVLETARVCERVCVRENACVRERVCVTECA